MAPPNNTTSSRRTGRVTLQDVAEEAGVGTMTGSRPLNKPDIVSVAFRQGILKAVAKTGYVPNPAASGSQVEIDGRSLRRIRGFQSALTARRPPGGQIQSVNESSSIGVGRRLLSEVLESIQRRTRFFWQRRFGGGSASSGASPATTIARISTPLRSSHS
jgi:hypothetical protein